MPDHRRPLNSVQRFLIISLLGASLGSIAAAQDESGAVRDPRPFKDMEELLRPAPAMPFDAGAARLAAGVTAALKAGKALEDKTVWPSLVELGPCWGTKELQEQMSLWVPMALANVGKALANAKKVAKGVPPSLEEGNRDYAGGNFYSATQKYAGILLASPDRFSARNNLALAQLHLGNGVVAQLELELLASRYPRYHPALVNLAVLYERLKQDRSAEFAGRAIEAEKSAPKVTFRDAYFLAVAGGKAVPPHLSELGIVPVQEREIPQDQQTVSSAEESLPITDTALVAVTASQPASGFLHLGVGRTAIGYLQERLNRLPSIIGKILIIGIWSIAIVVFLAVSLMAVAIAIGVGGRTTAAIVFFVVGGVLYPLAWGIPSHYWWGLYALYLLLGTLSAAEAAD